MAVLFSRRQALARAVRPCLAAVAAGLTAPSHRARRSALAQPTAATATDAAAPNAAAAIQSDRAQSLLDDLARRAADWFQKYQHPETGLVLDRGPNRAAAPLPIGAPSMASVSAAGFYLSLLPAWAEQRRLDPRAAELAAVRLLRTTLERVEHHEGVLYHFVDWQTGRRWRNSEVATLDTAIFLNGAMVVAEAFGGDAARLSTALLDRVAWPKFVIDNPRAGRPQLAMGWSPERGYFAPADVRSSEMAMAYFLAVGSRQAVEPDLWRHTRIDRGVVAGHELLHPEFPLFTSNFGLAWHELRGRVDRDGIDLHANARAAALANRDFCRSLADRYPAFSESQGGWWGLSAGDSPRGYVAVGPVERDVDGTLWPLAALAAWPWIDDELRADLPRWADSSLWQVALGDYGLAPLRATADATWAGPDLIGIDLGSFAAGVENARDRGVSRYWMRHPVAQRALERLEYRPAAVS